MLTVIFCFIILILILYFYNQYKFSGALKEYSSVGDFVKVGDIKLHYISKGIGSTLVFLHGGILNCNDFNEIIDLAVAQGYHAIAFDRPGYGFSERYKNKKMTPSDQAILIHEVLLKLGVEKPIIIGHSWSGAMVLSYALMYPNEISGIVTLAAAMYKEGYPAENGDFISLLINTPVIGRLLLNTLLFPLGKLMAEIMLKATFSPDEVPDEYRKQVFAFYLRPSQFKANREDVIEFVPEVKRLSSRYKEIKKPVVIVVGEKDPFGIIAQGHRLHEDIPHSKLVVIPKVGHMIPQCHPQKIIGIINYYFAEKRK